MRLEIQLDILTVALNKIELEISNVNHDPNRVAIKNIDTIRDGLNDIRDFGYLNPELGELLEKNSFYNYVGNNLVLPPNEFQPIQATINNLKHKIQVNIDILKSIVVPTTELTLCIKVIEYDSLSDIANELIVLDKIINQVITHKKLNGKYNFANFDIGSSWINLILNSLLVYSVLGSVIWSASVIRKKIIEGNTNNEYTKQMNLKTETIKNLQEAQSELIKKYVETEAKNIMSEYDLDDSDHEYKNRLIYAINEFSKLIINGVEIRPATIAPEEAKNLFPDFSKLDLIESKTKLLNGNNK